MLVGAQQNDKLYNKVLGVVVVVYFGINYLLFCKVLYLCLVENIIAYTKDVMAVIVVHNLQQLCNVRYITCN